VASPQEDDTGLQVDPIFRTVYESRMKVLRGLAVVLTVLAGQPVDAIAGTFVTLSLGTYTGNIQSKLIAQGPLGHITTTDADPVPFDIPATGNNYDELALNPDYGLSIKVDVADVTDVFTLINAYAPARNATIGVITFNFSNGTSRSVPLVGGGNVRDFYRGTYANTLFRDTAENVFTYAHAPGGAHTGNTRRGPVGTYVVDEQHFPLGTAEIGKTLTSIVITTPYRNRIVGGSGRETPIILGLTVETTTLISSAAPSSRSVRYSGSPAIDGVAALSRRLSVRN
jgi:hypothetical protein